VRDLNGEEVTDNEVFVPYEFWHYTTAWTLLSSYYRAGVNKSPYSILDYRQGTDFCVSKNGNITRFYQKEATPIFDETNPSFDEHIRKIEANMRQPIITIPTKREIEIFAQKIEEAAEQRASFHGSSRTHKLGPSIAGLAVQTFQRHALALSPEVQPAPIVTPAVGEKELTLTVTEEETAAQESDSAFKPSIQGSSRIKRATSISNDRVEYDDEQLAEEQTDAAPPASKPLERELQEALEPAVSNTSLPIKGNFGIELRNKIIQVVNRERHEQQ
jgi:hypothetical protein